MKGYSHNFFGGLTTTFAVLAISGFLLIPTALDLRFGWDVYWRLPGQQRLWVAALHSGAALLMCAFAGALLSIHMRVGWRSGRHLRTGLSTTGSLGIAAITALGVFYLGDEGWLVSASAGHILLGTASVVCGAAHWTVGFAERARRRAPRDYPRRHGTADANRSSRSVSRPVNV